jgi:hypothetical protein
MTFGVSGLRLLRGPRFPGGDNEEWDLCSDGSDWVRTVTQSFLLPLILLGSI